MDRNARRNAGTLPAATSAVEVAIIQAVAYADVFDYPLTAEQVHRYLVGVEAPLSTVARSAGQRESAVRAPGLQQGAITSFQGARRSSTPDSGGPPCRPRPGPRPGSTAVIIARLPFVRMVAVSGALTMDNMEANTDIDFFIVTEPRATLADPSDGGRGGSDGGAKRPGHLPQLLSLRTVYGTLEKRNLFTAHELAQMVPVYGLDVYRRMCRLNSWAVRFLPNAFGTSANGEAHATPPVRTPPVVPRGPGTCRGRRRRPPCGRPPGHGWRAGRCAGRCGSSQASWQQKVANRPVPGQRVPAEVDFAPIGAKGTSIVTDQTTIEGLPRPAERSCLRRPFRRRSSLCERWRSPTRVRNGELA